MKKLMGGALALVLGVILFSCFSHSFVRLCLGVMPVILILAGSIAIYVSYVSLSDELEKEQEKEATNIVEFNEPEIEIDKDTKQVVFLGNTQSMIFHDPKCNFAESKKCTQPFYDKDSAIEAGYSPCGVCTP